MFFGGLSHSEHHQCAEAPNVTSSVSYLLVIPSITYNIGFVISLLSLIEFTAAQTPNSVLGMMTTFVILWIALTAVIGWSIFLLILHFLPEHWLGLPCFFYRDFLYGCLSLIFFILYVWIARRYRLRERSDIVPIYLFAENYFEKEYAREQAYLRELYHDQINFEIIESDSRHVT